MPILADDDVVVHGDAERGGDVDDRLGHLDVRLRRRRIAGGMAVQDALETLAESRWRRVESVDTITTIRGRFGSFASI